MTGRPRIAAFSAGGRSSYGLVTARGLVDLGIRYPQWRSLDEVIAAGGLQRLCEESAGISADFALEEIVFEIPVQRPEKLICVGVNFPDRNAEYKDGKEAPPNPSLFIRFPRSFVGHEQPLLIPHESKQLDYEGEIVIVVGKAGRRIPQSEALAHVTGLSLCNEGTLRDWVRHAKFNVTQGKNFDSSGSIGPWLVPYTDASQLDDIELLTRVNGEVRQRDRTSRMIFSFAKIISYISTFTTLQPGDVIVTGTPSGAGARLEPPVWLKPGDVVEVEAEGIGVLRNTVKSEEPL